MIADFSYFIKKGTVKVQTPDTSRVKFLIKESAQSYSMLLRKIEKLSIDDESANDFVKSCYDILMEIIRANMLMNGYNASGSGAHEAEVSYAKKLGLSHNELRFLDQLRYFRNGMLYYGTIVDAVYAMKVIAFTKKMYKNIKIIN